MDISFYFKLFLRRLHYFLIMVVLCSAAGIYLARALPTVFEADARLLVENEQIPGDLAASTVQINANEQLQIIRQRILTRDILIDMANRLDIYADARRAGDAPLNAEEIVADLRNRIRIDIPRANRRGESGATIVSIGFQGPSGRIAAEVTNEMVNLVLAEDVTMRTRTARQTLEFFEQQVEQLDRELSEAASEVLTFQEANIAALPDSLEFRRGQQVAAQERLVLIERQLAEIRDREARIRQIIANNGSIGDLGVDLRANETPEAARLRALKEQRDSLLTVLSPENPRMRLLDQQITPLEEVVAAQQQVASEAGANGTTEILSPIEMQLLDMEGQLAFYEDQRVLIQDEIAALTRSIAQTPANAVVLAALERNRASIERRYETAVVNLAKAETGDTIEGLSKGQKITIIEPAIAPRTPSSPNRPLIAAAGVGAGIFLGVAIVVLLEFFRAGIRRPVDLTKGLGITPFATLPYMLSRKEVVRRRLFVWGGFVGVLAAVALSVWLVDRYYMPIDRIAELIQQRLR